MAEKEINVKIQEMYRLVPEIYRIAKEANEFAILNNKALKEISKKLDSLKIKK